MATKKVNKTVETPVVNEQEIDIFGEPIVAETPEVVQTEPTLATFGEDVAKAEELTDMAEVPFVSTVERDVEIVRAPQGARGLSGKPKKIETLGLTNLQDGESVFFASAFENPKDDKTLHARLNNYQTLVGKLHPELKYSIVAVADDTVHHRAGYRFVAKARAVTA